MTEVDEQGRYVLPQHLLAGTRVLIEVVNARTDVVRRQSLFIAEPGDWRIPDSSAGSDSFGQPIERKKLPVTIVGADVPPTESAPPFRPYPFLLREARARANRELYLVGRSPGQVVSWPDRGLPDEWQAVWVIRKNKGKEPLFCGRGIEDSAPDLSVSGSNIMRWKQLIWSERDRIQDPVDPVLRRLWKRYQAVARDL